jgi:hypothetical protein
MRRIAGVLASVAFILTAATDDKPSGQFQGEWCTTIGPIKLEQKGDAVSGTYGTMG